MMPEKTALRQSMRARLDAHAAALGARGFGGWWARWHQARRTRQLQQRLYRFLCPMTPQGLAAYHPMRGEMDLTGLMTQLHALGWTTALPCIPAETSERVMHFRAWIPGAPTRPNRFGILEPADAAEMRPDIVLVPLVAFDTQGGRLGYGKGFYDTTLSALLTKGKRCLLIGIAYDFQWVDLIPVEAHDVMLDWIATPQQMVQIRPAVTQS